MERMAVETRGVGKEAVLEGLFAPRELEEISFGGPPTPSA
jgi:hypothetical protein